MRGRKQTKSVSPCGWLCTAIVVFTAWMIASVWRIGLEMDEGTGRLFTCAVCALAFFAGRRLL